MHNQSRKQSLMVASILLLVITGQLGIDIYLPSMPSMTHYFDVSRSVIQNSMTIYLLMFGISQLFLGPVSDRFGRRKILFIGLGFYLLGVSISIFCESISVFLFARAMQGFGTGIVSVNTRAIVRDAFKNEDLMRVLTQMTMMWSIVPIVAPLIGGYLQEHFSWRANFVFMFTAVFLNTIFVYFYLPETIAQKHKKLRITKVLQNYRSILSDKPFLPSILSAACCMGIMISFNTVSPFLLQNYLHLSPVVYGWIMFVIAIAYLIGSFANTYFRPKLGKFTSVKIGATLIFGSSMLLLLFGLFGILNLAVIIIPAFLAILGVGFTYIIFSAEAITPYKTMAATAGALIGGVQLFSASTVSLIAAQLPAHSQLPIALFMVTLSLLVIVLFITRTARVLKVETVE